MPGCPCVDFKQVAQDKNYVGNCLSTDSTGFYFCYVRKGCRNCDANSGSFPQFCKNYSNCRLPFNMNNEGAANPDK